ncbi:putative phage protein gp47/JayE [Clostridium beijerinckii]|uniref:baseplate J/gp47 family protein n=1 Tax=Clostridium beijerinckii TaxID=1520 RepID=UPI0014945F94|nr:baseplate J/gp47 family protein [Clostridium beijerinckii]NOW85524.1 putative phage protein gp47/JayE [Clostridium beijerinckii]
MSSSEAILSEMLADIDDKYDKSKGSFVYDVLSSGANKFAQYDESINTMVERRFATTATGKDLQYVVVDHGVIPKTSTKATTVVTITGIAGSPVPKGEKVATDSINFIFTQDRIIPDSKTVDVPVECEKYGNVGNVPIGAIKYFPKTLAGLQTVTNKEEVTNGYNAEEDPELKERFFEKVQEPATSGNEAEYKAWAKSITGVSDAKVIPIWDKSNGKNGAGTVKVIIINSDKRAADQTLIDSVKTYIEGVRPVGATVTVISALELSINVSATLILAPGQVLDNVKTVVETNITNYLKTIAFKQSFVSFAAMSSIIFNSQGVIDVSNLNLNGDVANVQIENEQVAVLGSVLV